MVDLARTDLMRDASELDQQPNLINCQNGTVDIRTKENRAHRRADYLTRIAPCEYHPERREKRFRRFLLEIMKRRPNLVSHLQRALGYSATGDVSEHALFLMYGPLARNGKDTLQHAVVDALGNGYVHTAKTAIQHWPL